MMVSTLVKILGTAILGTVVGKRMVASFSGYSAVALVAGTYLYFISFTVATLVALQLIWRLI